MDEVLKGNKIGKDGEEAVEGSNFSLLIKHYRRLRNYSLKDLEAISGISSSYIFRLESSKRNSPSINKVIALAKGLRIPSAVLVATLLHGLEEGERLSSLPEVLIQNNFFLGSGMLSSEGKGYLIRIVEHIDRAEWSPQTKMRELYQLSELIDEFKEAIN